MIRRENFIEILNPSNPHQLTLASLTGQIAKLNDKYSQSEVFSLSKNGKISLPRTNRQQLDLDSPYITFQVFIPQSKTFNIEIGLLDSSITKRKLLFTHCRGINKDTLHCKVTNSCFPRDSWANICIDLSSFSASCFGYAFKEIENIYISGFCKLRRIFCSQLSIEDINLPNNYKLPGYFVNLLVSPSIIEDTFSLLDATKRQVDENSRVIDTKVKLIEKNPYSGKVNKSSTHIHRNQRKSIGIGSTRKNTLYKLAERTESIYDNIMNSLGTIRHSTPPFVHINQDPLYYDPVSKSYIS